MKSFLWMHWVVGPGGPPLLEPPLLPLLDDGPPLLVAFGSLQTPPVQVSPELHVWFG